MAYLVLARKYRPERFGDMVGQEHVTRTLQNAIREDRVHHAYLFCGVRGLGKTTAARILAKCLVCQGGPTPEPCNACEQCRAVNEGRSVDVLEIDGASNNKVEHVRALREQVNYLPQTARRKVYIIDEVHMLTDSAFNALLKTLEEPPPHVSFIFATTDAHKVLPTILSRVSRMDFRRLGAQTLSDHLRTVLGREGIAAEAGAIRLVTQAADGSVRDALTLLDKVIAFAADPANLREEEVRTILGHADRFAVADLVDAVLARDPPAVLARFEAITRDGGDLLQIGLGILQHLRDLTVVRLCGSSDALLDVGDALRARLQEQAATVDVTLLAQHFDRFLRVVEGLEAGQAPRLALEMGLLELTTAEALLPIGDVIAQLQAVASTPGSGGDPGPGPRAPPGKKGSGSPRAEPGSSAQEAAQSDLARTLHSLVDDTLGRGRSDAKTRDLAPDESFALTPPPAPTAAAIPDGARTASDSVPWRTLAPLAAWEAFLQRVRGEDELLFAVLGQLGLAGLSGGVLELAAERRSFAREQLDERPDLRARLVNLLEDHLGSTFEVRLRDEPPSLPDRPSVALLEAHRREQRQLEVETRARSDPRIGTLLAAFDGQLRAVRPREAPTDDRS